MGILIALLIGLLNAEAIELRDRVAILDTGLNIKYMSEPWVCTEGHRDLTDTGLNDTHGHGTNVALIIARNINPEKQCALIIKWTEGGSVNNNVPIMDVYDTLKGSTVKWINYSASGNLVSLGENIRLYDMSAWDNIHITVAAGNDKRDLSVKCNIFPACYNIQNKHWHVVANGKNGVPQGNSNYNGPVTEMEDGNEVTAGGYMFSGTSQAAALYTSKLLRKANGR